MDKSEVAATLIAVALLVLARDRRCLRLALRRGPKSCLRPTANALAGIGHVMSLSTNSGQSNEQYP